MNPEQKVVQYLAEAHALEAALVQTLTAHIAITPRSEYRDLLERHLGETRDHLAAVQARLGELRETRNPLEVVYGVVQAALGQAVAAGKLPLDLVRGTGGEEKLVKNAKDEAASEALEIATYDALEALAEAVGDEETATLARTHRAQEEAMLAELRGLIPQLARDVLAAQAGDAGGGKFAAPTAAADAADAARAVASEVRRTVERAAQPRAEQTDANLPIPDYDSLPVQQVVPKLRILTMPELERIEAHERAGRARKQILDRIAKLRSSEIGRAGPPRRI